ncbi:MAG: tRNA uridine-5-carboxymethylaminomethyl(34) synthesis GTPase MnmE [Clostridia bacterium]|nr:tRNA uridine-5-carboxymethylaminomethyl(34) synthesis GTPase MnmE [Clostridia bacterium]
MINDTIAAIATALGEGGIGIVRVSGPKAIEMVDKVFASPKGVTLASLAGYRMVYGNIINSQQQKVIDEVLVSVMRKPHSFTAEDVVEINCHGGMVPLKACLEVVLHEGARLAEPGEFSKRAFLNGRVDLAQAESIIDIIRSKTEAGLRVAVNQLQGRISAQVKLIRDKILELLAFIEAGIDFPEDDIEELSRSQIVQRSEEVKGLLAALLATAEGGKIFRDGISVVIIGKPNVGKSSLLNALLREKRAIVTDIPGTTRDVIEEYLNIKGIPVKIVDTAGIRETEDIVERLGVEKSKELFQQADLVLLVLDAATEITDEDRRIIQLIGNQHVLVVVNKTDIQPHFNAGQLPEIIKDKPLLLMSVMEGEGISRLEENIYQLVTQGMVTSSDTLMVSNLRHKDALVRAMKALDGVRAGLSAGMATDFLAIDLKGCWEALGEITGDTVGEDLLDQIFSRFCIGK